MSLSDFLSIAVVLFCFAAIPGPDFLMVSRTTLRFGKLAGAFCATGVAAGFFVYTALAVAGVGVIVATSFWLQAAIKFFGGLYLCHVAWRVWQAAPQPLTIESQSREAVQQALTKSFFSGLTTSLTNPKSIVFFSSIFFSVTKKEFSFVDHASLVLLSTFLAFAWFQFVAWSLSLPASKELYARSKLWFDRAGALIFAFFGARLLLSCLD